MSIFRSRKIIFLIVIFTLVSLAVWFVLKYRSDQNEPLSPINNVQGTKAYRNEEWGFEFSYPQNLILKENTFKSYYSKFNLELFTPIEEKRDKTFLVNIALPEFAERSFSGLEKTTEKVIVDDVSGVKYQYKFNERKETVVILPFNEYRLILGIYYEEYEDVFNQILTSFKFLK